MSGGLAIEARGIEKSFGKVRALDGVDLAVPAGSILGLLGPNGAGKTTMVRILATLLKPDAGEARVAGLDVAREAGRLRSQIGLAGQYAAVDENLTGFENLEMVGRLYHLGKAESRKRADELLEVFDLTDARDRIARTYSGGMRRRLDLGAALVARPPVLFLDEPTTVIDHGRVIADGTSDELKDRVGGERLEVQLEPGADVEAAIRALSSLGEETPVAEDGIVRVPLRRRTGAIVAAVRALDHAGVGVADITIRRPTLDDVFISLTGRAAEDAAEEAEAA
jgi:ABC-2 type transport system ATP-binding protein